LKPTDRQIENYNRQRGADASGGTGLPVHTRESIAKVEARAFGRKRRGGSFKPKRAAG
jgi:hypothetical protein